jgi:hypothetical protein
MPLVSGCSVRTGSSALRRIADMQRPPARDELTGGTCMVGQVWAPTETQVPGEPATVQIFRTPPVAT